MHDIYLDHAATTPVREEVFEAMKPYFDGTKIGNASSIHRYGRKVRVEIDKARRTVAKSIGARHDEIIFTSGGTEADNLAIRGTAIANRENGRHIISTNAEHHAVLHVLEQLEREGFEVTYLPVGVDGAVTAKEVEAVLRDDTILVTIMHGNNETGIVNPIAEIGEMLRTHQAVFHSDAVQSYAVLDLNVEQLGIDLLSASAHKLNGPKGAGFLYVKNQTNVLPLSYGGEQEKKLRPGTENAAAIIGLESAVLLREAERTERYERYLTLKKMLLERLDANGVDYERNDYIAESTLPHIVNISFQGVPTEPLLAQLDLAGVAVSSGSACTAGSFQPSHVLQAMFGDDDERIKTSIRFSIGSTNTEQQVIDTADTLAEVTALIRSRLQTR
ncbi:cysteine desulfurase family protein [Geomicrobium sp. JCM 19055]|uniref:cysteine desulfurase family protein n=1 Tax=Geomicrobium sp. JCM 19055 TaxID=1460649 RepID=UPI00045EDC3E|nr:cysteine desulfurase family protein [Geomicrobium sp. JCM 19055]GAJ99033.1 cysteine desulfurase [Geomicrobium sp. JCM 19055]